MSKNIQIPDCIKKFILGPVLHNVWELKITIKITKQNNFCFYKFDKPYRKPSVKKLIWYNLQIKSLALKAPWLKLNILLQCYKQLFHLQNLKCFCVNGKVIEVIKMQSLWVLNKNIFNVKMFQQFRLRLTPRVLSIWIMG